jgi:RNA polymerase sigma factor for flagellar operon FliA
MEGLEPADDQLDPFRSVADVRFRSALAEAIAGLPEREKMVMSLYYQDELNLKEIGMVLGVTESRVSQLHGQAISRLKARLSGWRGSPDQPRGG